MCNMCSVTKMATQKVGWNQPPLFLRLVYLWNTKSIQTFIWLFNATTVHLTLLSILCKAEKTTTDSDLKNNLSAEPGHENHRLEQPYFVKNIVTSISKFSPVSNLPFSFVPEMSIKMLFLTQRKPQTCAHVGNRACYQDQQRWKYNFTYRDLTTATWLLYTTV